MKENAVGLLGKSVTAIVVGLLTLQALLNFWRAEAPHPERFVLALAGCALFIAAKLQVMRQGRLVSFGSKHMAPAAANLYRAGYWLMCAGALLAFG